MRILTARDDALLIELDDPAEALALVQSLEERPIPGVTRLVHGARTVLVTYDPRTVPPAVIAVDARSRDLSGEAHRSATGLLEIPVRYDGEDLGEVSRILGVSTGEVVRMHTGSEYVVAFTGFAPGFGYLSGGHPALDVPRRAVPRTRVPAGAVALGGAFCGVYPRESPGGWQLIGTTHLPMWDLERDPPALLRPGLRVRFVDADADAGAGAGVDPRDASGRTPPEEAARATPMPVPMPLSPPVPTLMPLSPPLPMPVSPPLSPTDRAVRGLEVLVPGLLTLVQDLGRPGFESMGVSSSGALDPVALRSANRLVGNEAGAAVLEVTFGGLRIVARGEQVVAVTGAPSPLVAHRVDGPAVEVPFGSPFALQDGMQLELGPPRSGIRNYLAVRGGIDFPPVLGSRSTDVLAGLGPAPLASGDLVPVGERAVVESVDIAEVLPDHGDDLVLDVVLGPRGDWFSVDAVETLAVERWVVTDQADRVGLRLAGRRIVRAGTAELPSEGVVAGALQIPPDGQPVLFLADHPVTGGYPVIGAVSSRHLRFAAQLRPGATVRFRPIGPFVEY